jgi:hypothetical protein
VNIPENVNWNELCMEFCRLSLMGGANKAKRMGSLGHLIRRQLILPTVEFPCLLRLYSLN